MSRNAVKGQIHSIQTLGTLDGPGVRFVLFLQGCNLRCGCCHNPDTWSTSGGTFYTPEEIVEKAEHYKTYFGEKGGITVSGGEPLLQAEFVRQEIAKTTSERNITIAIPASVGVAVSTAGFRDYASMFNAADEALYRAKKEGRNRICVIE